MEKFPISTRKETESTMGPKEIRDIILRELQTMDMSDDFIVSMGDFDPTRNILRQNAIEYGQALFNKARDANVSAQERREYILALIRFNEIIGTERFQEVLEALLTNHDTLDHLLDQINKDIKNGL